MTIYIDPGESYDEVCLKMVLPGDTCYFNEGYHRDDGITRTHGTEDAPITITGHENAVIKGSNTQDRVFQVCHDWYILDGLNFNGKHNDGTEKNDYVSTAIYVLGCDKKSKKDTIATDHYSSVFGLTMKNLFIKDFGGECVHFRYFVTHAEVKNCHIESCGTHVSVFGAGGKVGEALYIGTALDQVDDGKTPEFKARKKGEKADNVDADVCAFNWIHHNVLNTYGNECVDVKEGSEYNLIENNKCSNQQDEQSGCIGFRGSFNTGRGNIISGCDGAALRVGGDKGHGEGNNFYNNEIDDCEYGAFNIMSPNQGIACGNTISDVTTIVQGSFKEQSQFQIGAATEECTSQPGDFDWYGGGNTATYYNDDGDDDVPAAVNGANDDGANDDGANDDGTSDDGANDDDAPAVILIETNESQGAEGLGECKAVVNVVSATIEDPSIADPDTDANYLFDADLETRYSLKDSEAIITFDLEEVTAVDGFGFAFFERDDSDDRIQSFSISLRKEDYDDDDDEDAWSFVLTDQESVVPNVMSTFTFTPSRNTDKVRFHAQGNFFNAWTALLEVEVCESEDVQPGALFGGMGAIGKELDVTVDWCSTNSSIVEPHEVKLVGGEQNAEVLFDNNFGTRWSTANTNQTHDMENDMVIFVFDGEKRI
ncbi:unnamed protein product, partial [Pylaiella littoralis]